MEAMGPSLNHGAHLCWLPDLLADRLPLVILVLLDGIEESLALEHIISLVLLGGGNKDGATEIVPRLQQTQRSAYPCTSVS
jgi:hypothetical protein